MINFINKMNIMLKIREIAKAPDVSYKMSSNVVIFFPQCWGQCNNNIDCAITKYESNIAYYIFAIRINVINDLKEILVV